MFRRGLLWLSLPCAPALAACSLLLGEGYTDPATGPTAGDASATTDSPTNDGGDGSTPAPTTEGGPENDGSMPGSDGGDGGGNSTCPTAAISFCDDFERGAVNDLKGAWDLVDVNASGTLQIATGANITHHLASAITAKGGQAQLVKAFVKQPAKVHLELSLTMKSFPSTGALYVAGVGMPNGAGGPSLIYLFANTTTFYLVQQVADSANYNGDPIPVTIGTKHRIVVDLTFNGKVKVTVDGNSKVDANAQTFLVAKPPNLHLGASSIDGNGDVGSFDVDDFVFTLD